MQVRSVLLYVVFGLISTVVVAQTIEPTIGICLSLKNVEWINTINLRIVE